VVEIEAAGGFAEIVQACEHIQVLIEFVRVSGVAAGYGAEFALTDEPVAEIGEERQVVSSEEAGELELGVGRQGPNVIQCDFGSVGLVALARIDGVVKIRDVDGDQAWNSGRSVISDGEQAEFVSRVQSEGMYDIELVLLAVFQAV
jgi:hypothetical protein